MYTLSKNSVGETLVIKTDAEFTTSFLEDPNNLNYQAYLAWLAEGNTPNPYVPPPAPPELTPAEKLAAAGLTVDDLKTLLGLI